MIKLLDILENKKKEKEKVLKTRRSPEERSVYYNKALQTQIQQYMKDGGKGDLDLGHAPITSLPDGLEVGGSLYLRNTLITSLPDGLKIRDNLNLYNTPITSLPDGLEVRGYLNLYNTPLSKKYSEDEIKQIIEDGGGYIGRDIYI